MNGRGWLKGFATIGVVGVTLFAFNNCASNHGEGSSAGSSSLSVTGLGKWTCADQLTDRTLFEQTYAKFFADNKCSRCHDGSGRAPGAFASIGPELAFQSFSSVGFALTNTRALTPHGDGAAGPQNASQIQVLTRDYLTGLNAIEACNTSAGSGENQDGDGRIHLKSKAVLPSATQAVQVSWNLGADVYPHSDYVQADLAGVTLVADVQIYDRPPIVSYVVSNPRLITTQRDIHVESLLFKLNGNATPSQRAFFLLEKDVRAWNNQHPDWGREQADPNAGYKFRAQLISGGAMVLMGEVRSTDVISVSMTAIRKVTLPPPDLGPKVKFLNTTMTVTESSTIIDIPIRLSAQPTSAVNVEVFFDSNTTVRDECCRQILDELGNTRGIRNFDRDIQDFDIDPNIKLNSRQFYHLTNSLGEPATNRGRYFVSFLPGNQQTDPTPTQNLRIKVVGDGRDENDETLTLTIDGNRLIGLQPDTSNQSFTLTIVDDDGPAPGGIPTFTQLMSNGGVLASACLKCHNSYLFRGGYDLTNYEQLLVKGILIPNQPDLSQMYIRMNAIQIGKQPMPLDGLLPSADRLEVADWILSGAKNN